MLQDILNHIISNVPLIAISVVMYFIAIRNIRIRKRESIYFIAFTTIVLFLAIIVEAEEHARNHGMVMLGTIFTSLGYIFRPLLLYIFFLLADMERKHGKLFNLLCGIPLVINFIIYQFPLFINVPGLSTIVFHYTVGDEGRLLFERGIPLNFSSHFFSAIYLGLLLYLSIAKFYGKHRRDTIILTLCAIIIVVTVVIEMIFHRHDLLNLVCAICCMINYVFIITVNSAKDPLTSLYDRRTFDEDIIRYKKIINGVIQIDMNELKYLNDHFGHEAGDIALNTLGNIFDSSINRETMCVYRLSGDEFLILMFNGSEEQLEEAVKSIRGKVADTMYSIAMGHQYIDKNSTMTFDEAMRIAEELMYIDKGKFYQSNGRDRRKA